MVIRTTATRRTRALGATLLSQPPEVRKIYRLSMPPKGHRASTAGAPSGPPPSIWCLIPTQVRKRRKPICTDILILEDFIFSIFLSGEFLIYRNKEELKDYTIYYNSKIFRYTQGELTDRFFGIKCRNVLKKPSPRERL